MEGSFSTVGHDLGWRTGEALRERLIEQRRDALAFSLGVVALTASVAALAAIVLPPALRVLQAHPEAGKRAPQLAALAALCWLGWMLGALLIRQQPDHRRNPLPAVLGATLAVGLIALLAFTMAADRWPPLVFGATLAILVTLALAAMGHVYEPADDYYLGWVSRHLIVDDPTTYRDDVDRMHIRLGFMAAFPHMILGGYSEVFGSSWLWRSLDPAEVRAAARVLIEADAAEMQTKPALEALPPGSRVRVFRALEKSGLLSRSGDGFRLTSIGRELVGKARGLRGE